MSGTAAVDLAEANLRTNFEAVHRRRKSRESNRKAKAAAESRRPDWRASEQREREVAERMARRFYPLNGSDVSEMPHVICCDYRYWQARRCGIDMLCPMLWDGQSDVWRAGTAWAWWVGKHYMARDEFLRKFRIRLLRR